MHGRVVELADSLDSGSSVHSGRAGSSPASPTRRNSRKAVSFFAISATIACPKPMKALGIPAFQETQGLFCYFAPIHIYSSLLSTVSPILDGIHVGVTTKTINSVWQSCQ